MTATLDASIPAPPAAPRNSAFKAFVAPARRSCQVWQLIVGLVAITVVIAIAITAQIVAMRWSVGAAAFPDWLDLFLNALTPTGALLLLASFTGMVIGPMLVTRLLHRRPALSLIGPLRIAARDFAVCGVIVAAIMALSLAVWSVSFDAVPNLTPQMWLSFLPLALVGLLVQTGGEEILFRGYLLQQLAARFRSPVIWMGLSAVAFAALHYQPQVAPLSRWLVVGWALVFGLAAADLTRVSGSIGAAWGFHFANNALAILLLATDGTIPGLALYLTPYGLDDAPIATTFAVDLITTLSAWALCRMAVRR